MYQNSKPKYLDQLVANQKLTPDGRDWLVLALDPFHDLSHQAAGYPDSDGSQTLVSCYQYQVDITRPAGVAGNWDAHIFTMPVSNSQQFTTATESGNWTSLVDKPATTAIGPLTIVTVPQGDPIFPHTTGSTTALPAIGVNDLISGVTRIIGLGYEVTNTTAEVLKQGAVTSYRMPQYNSPAGSSLVWNIGETNFGVMPTRRLRAPPSTVAQANLLKGTRTWDASSGVYATAVLNNVVNPMEMCHNTMLLFEPTAFTGAVGDVYHSPYVAAISAPGPSVSPWVPEVTQAVPYDTTGSIFTGLSNETTLTVKLKVYVERAPTMAEAQLAVLATPSAGYDVTALELYSHAISQLPVAVTVSENGLGDWFRGVVRVIRDVAGPIGTIAGAIVPGATLVGHAAQQIAGKMDNWITKREAPSVSSSIQPRAKNSTKEKKKPKASKKNARK